MSSSENQIPPPPTAALPFPPPESTAPPESTDAENIPPPPPQPPSLEELSRRGVRSLFLPHILNLISSSTSPPPNPREILVLVNFRTGAMTMVEGSGGIEEFLREKDGPLPASKASIEAMRSVEVEGFECAICLDEERGVELVKEMPCKHLFHSGCIRKWLGIHGSCPVCRFQMPVEDEAVKNGGDENGDGGDDMTRGSEDDGGGGGGEGRGGFVFHIYVTGSLRRESGLGLDTGSNEGGGRRVDSNDENLGSGLDTGSNEGGVRSVDPNDENVDPNDENLGSSSDTGVGG